MQSTVSVSKGVFVFPNGQTKGKNAKKKSGQALFDKIFRKELWYTTYIRQWEKIEHNLKDLHYKTYNKLLNDVVSHIKQAYENQETLMLEGVIPSATLLTGVSQPDHVSQFSSLIDMIRDEVTPHVALVNSQDGSSVKHLVENTVWQLIHGQESLDSSTEDDMISNKIKKSRCTMKTLKNWYQLKYVAVSPVKKKRVTFNKSLVIIIPDFESFNCNVLQDFVMIVSSYLPFLPFVFVFGVATAVSALHKSFPYHVSSKLLIKVFHNHSSPVYMNQVLEDIFLIHTSPFHLSAKALQLLTDVFLFYDFSVTALVRSIKYCIMEHYFAENLKSLCCDRNEIEQAIMNLEPEDLESIRHLYSIRPYLESQDDNTKIKLFMDDNFFRQALHKELMSLHDYLYRFYLCVRMLSALFKDMPRNLLGKSVREIYIRCVSECIINTTAFKESMQLLSFQSQLKLADTIKNMLQVVNSYLQIVSPANPLRPSQMKSNANMDLNNDSGDNFANTIRVHLLNFLRQIEHANTESTLLVYNMETNDDLENTPGNRYKLKEKLFKATRADKVQSEFEMVRSRFVNYLEDVFSKGLQPPSSRPFYELLFFNDVSSVKKQIVGAPRGAIHTALSNPAHYLQCHCCHLTTQDSLVATLPDICLAYKLHRECGKHINLYDWLQAFAAVLLPEDEQRHQDPNIQYVHGMKQMIR